MIIRYNYSLEKFERRSDIFDLIICSILSFIDFYIKSLFT